MSGRSASLTPYDAADTVLRGWEMQTGVIAFRRSPCSLHVDSGPRM